MNKFPTQLTTLSFGLGTDSNLSVVEVLLFGNKGKWSVSWLYDWCNQDLVNIQAMV